MILQAVSPSADPSVYYWILFIVIAILSFTVQNNLNRKFEKYAKLRTPTGSTGYDVARRMLSDYGIPEVKITCVEGKLTDHYNPENNTVNLSKDVYYGNSITSAAVAAHECGHAVQHAKAYAPVRMRSALVPVVQFSSKIVTWVLLAGILLINAFPGHNLVIAALGVFILWLGWYGFNGAAATDVPTLGSVFLTTTVAPAVATVVCMIFTWIKYGKPDVSMCLNASLAGLVAITAPCDVTDCAGAAIIGAVSGLLVVFGVWFNDNITHVDDPVGAVAVHMFNGIWGTIAVGLFATSSAPGFSVAGISEGLFYGGGISQLIKQLGGMLITIAWTVVTITIAFLVIKNTIGLRVSEEEEITGLDATEHGLPSAYAGFSIMDISNTMTMSVNENTNLGESSYEKASDAKRNAAVPVVRADAAAVPEVATGISKVVIIAKLSRYEALKRAMNDLGVTGMTVTQVMGCGIQKGAGERYRGVEIDATLLPKVKLEVVVSAIPVDAVIAAAKKTLYTGHIGDGKIFVYPVSRVVKIRTGEEDFAALQDVE